MPGPVVPPRLDFAIGDLKDSDNRQIKWLDGVGLVPEVLDSLRYDGVRVADDRDDFKPNVQSFCIGLSLACAACGPTACARGKGTS